MRGLEAVGTRRHDAEHRVHRRSGSGSAQLEEQIPDEVEGGAAERERVGRWVVVLPHALELLQFGQDAREVLGLGKMGPQDSVGVRVVREQVVTRRPLSDAVDAVDLDLDDPLASGLDGDLDLPEHLRLRADGIM